MPDGGEIRKIYVKKRKKKVFTRTKFHSQQEKNKSTATQEVGL